MERRIAVRGIGFSNGKLLVVRHKNSQGMPANYWAVPGGGLDIGEDIVQGLHREMIEETGIAPQIGRLLFVQQYIGAGKQGNAREEIEFFFELTNTADYQAIDLTQTTHGALELAAIEWLDPSTIPLLPEFLQSYNIAQHIASNAPVYVYNGGQGK